MIGRTFLPAARQSAVCARAPYLPSTLLLTSALRPTSLSFFSSSSQTQNLCQRRIPIQRRLLNSASHAHTPELVSVHKHKLGSVPSPAENIGEPPIKQPNKEEKRRGKLWDSADEAVRDLKSGSVILSAGFGLCGVAETLITALKNHPNLDDLSFVSNNAGITHTGGLAPLIEHEHKASSQPKARPKVRKITLSYVGTNKALELSPQGSIAERLRCAGHGIPGVWTRTGVDTVVEHGGIVQKYVPDASNGEQKGQVEIPGDKKETKIIDGKKYLFEPAIKGDVAILRAWKVDKAGNCRFRYTTRAFAPLMAKAAKLSIVEAENIVEIGELGPMDIDLPGIYIDRIVPATIDKSIEIVTLRKPKTGEDATSDPKLTARLKREKIARRAAKELKDGYYCNLGVGMPVLAASYLEPGVKVWLQSENGILGMGEYPTEDEVDADIINAGKETVTLVPGASVFDSSESFGMIRGGHVDVSILGAMEVSASGDLANFMIPGKLVKGMGGAMDLCSNPDDTKVIVVTDHLDKHGQPKVVSECSLPLTASRAVSRIITDMAVFDVDRLGGGGLTLVEIAEGVTVDALREVTGAEFQVAEHLGEFR
ncbi:hypothetical protein FFLO_06870 [Filobasidium floriforme]|uniref:Succinyl-CoA:3-ketoacid-coenzyme A transferase n=1 Tax=Filobasidium floriforme TaxID=5210 RepID=A0A8K0NK65_9TREE|nr:hypothetical protein FFLO_06870 [Filobasidium floriforme]